MKRIHLSYLIIICLTFFITVGCREKSYSDTVREVVNKYLGKHIVFPDSLPVFIAGKRVDNETLKLSDPKFKILTIINTHGCTACNMQLESWNRFASNIENGLGDYVDLELIYVLETEPSKEIFSIAKSKDFRRPLTFDPEKKIRKSNRLPDEQEFSTFLLNSQNKILAIGNPIMIPKVADLFLKKTETDISESASDNLPITLSEKNVSLGVIDNEEPIISVVTVTNITDSIIRISNIDSSCECVKPTMKYRVLRPKTESDIVIRFTPDSTTFKEKRIYRTIQIYVEGVDNPSEIVLYGIVDSN